MFSQDTPGVVRLRALGACVQRSPHEGRTVVFGRNPEDVHLTVGGDDPRVSRRHGALTYRDGRWWVRALGRLPIRMGDRLLFVDEEPVPLPTGFTPLVVHGSPGREHLVEVYVSDGAGGHRPWADEVTRGAATWALSPEERIALIVLGQRYLYQEPHPQPLTWRAAAAQLAELQPERQWRQGRVEHLVLAVRQRLSAKGVAGLTREEVGEPVGNTLNHNLLVELLRSTTLRPGDVDVLDG
jgi:FHA domain